MATVTYTLDHRCANGGHTTLNVNFNGIDLGNFGYETDELRASLASLTQDQREFIALMVIKMHLTGKTRAQIVTEFGSPVVVTI